MVFAMTMAWADAAPLLSASSPVIEGELGGFVSSWTIDEREPGLVLATLKLTSPEPATPPAIKLKWDFPSVDIAGAWTPKPGAPKLDHLMTKVVSRGVLGLPMLCYFSAGDRNRMTVAVSDALRPTTLRGVLKEEDARIYMSLELFHEKQPDLKSYEVTLRFDSRKVPYYTSLQDTTRWWAGQEGYQPAPSPEAARLPLYSTWYSYHQQLDTEKLLEECRIGGEMGLSGIIIDDGWQTLDGNRGYAFTGDWRPERIPEMKDFVDQIHALGQKCLLWYSVPMVGDKSDALKRFKGKTLRYVPGFGAHVLDPRYPEVREFLIGTYEAAVRDWGLDGLKLDFIAMFAAVPAKDLTVGEGRDYASVDVAVDEMMTEVITRLRKIKPDIGIEFRQPYNGPLMRKYGNMLRAVDCPNSAQTNRSHIVDLRLIADRTAVHSDMIMWHPDEPVEVAALQILNVLFSVPQISVRLGEVSESHRTMLDFWMKYWVSNRSVLLDGHFEPAGPAYNYPMIVGRTEEKLIAVIYQDLLVSPGAEAPDLIDVINAKPGTRVVIDFEKDYGTARVRTVDALGRKVAKEVISIEAGPHAWDVPSSGMLQIRRQP